MNPIKMTDKKSIQAQYITDEAGNKSAIILSLTQFDELFDKMNQLAQFAEELRKTAISASSSQPTHQVIEVMSDDENSLQQQIGFLKQNYEILDKILDNLKEYNDLKTDLDRKLQIQRLINYTETEIQEIRRRLGQLKKQTHSATLHYVPELPNYLILNQTLVNTIKDELLAEATSKQRPPLVLHAPSGTGKSVLAAALARDSEIKQAFPEGIFWLTLGNETDLLMRQVLLLQALDESTTDVFDIEEGTKRLHDLCLTRACLVILDDIWDPQDVLAFNIEGEHCQLLITTCDGHLPNILQYFINNTKGYEINPLTKEQALEFFTHYADQPDMASATMVDLEELVHTCDYLPLSLKLTACVAREQSVSNWGELLERLGHEEDEFSDKYPHALMQALQLNVEALGEPADYYLALAVFNDYAHIPQSVVLMLWRYLYQLSREDADHFINNLAHKGLLQLDETASHRYLSLHAFQHDYLCAEAELEKLHSHLLAAYRRQCGQHGWISGPNDGYFFEYLCMHLHHANRHNELKLLLLDFDWMYNKLQATSIHALLNDYEWFENNEDLEIIKKTLYEAAPVLHTNKPELANQLLDRLWGEEDLKTHKDIQALLNQAKETSPNWHWQPHFEE